MIKTKKKTEAGQSLVMVTLMLLAFLAMLALILDGGMTYWQRRNAQNAADAGALAGAEVLCHTEDVSQAQNAALDYAINRNGASTATASAAWLDPGGMVTVQTNINFQTFFARIFGMDAIDAPGYAKSGCAPPAGVGVMPVAWSCKAPIGQPPPVTECILEYMDDWQQPNPDNQCIWGDDPMYIIADSNTIDVDILCQDPPNSGLPSGTIDCDLDGDNVNDVNILSGGARSWLDLNGGGGGASELKDWVEGDYEGLSIAPHHWVPVQNGVTGSVYDTVHDHILQKDVVIPVFDLIHPGGPPASVPHGQDIIVGNESHDYFHLITFAFWRTTCVESGSHKKCDARDALDDILDQAGWSNGKIKSLMTMEGCFVKGSVGGIGGEPGQGVDAGVYTVFLME